MAKKIYLGRMIGDLQTDINAMSSDMVQVVQELINVKTAIGIGTAEVNIRKSDNIKVTTTKPINVLVGSAYTNGVSANIVSMATGSCRMVLKLKVISTNSTGGNVSFGYQRNTDSWETINVFYIGGVGSAEKDVIFDLSLNRGDKIVFATLSHVPTKMVTSFEVGTTIGYDIIDIVNDTAIILD